MVTKKRRTSWKAKTDDGEVKAIIAIRKALEGLDVQSKGRVLTYLIDRARQDFEDSTKALVGNAAKLPVAGGSGSGTYIPPKPVAETEPQPTPPTPPVPDEPQPEPAHA
jgi:hypothetical protein